MKKETKPDFYETWKGIAAVVGRSERWCRYMAQLLRDPLPVYKVGGIVRLDVAALETWLVRQRGERTGLREPPQSGACSRCGVVVPLRTDGAVKAHKVADARGRAVWCVGVGHYPKKPPLNGDGPGPLCDKYLGDNDATCPRLACVRPRGHDGLCDNVQGDAPPVPVEMPCPVCGTHPVPASCVRGECDPEDTGDVIRWDRSA